MQSVLKVVAGLCSCSCSIQITCQAPVPSSLAATRVRSHRCNHPHWGPPPEDAVVCLGWKSSQWWCKRGYLLGTDIWNAHNGELTGEAKVDRTKIFTLSGGKNTHTHTHTHTRTHTLIVFSRVFRFMNPALVSLTDWLIEYLYGANIHHFFIECSWRLADVLVFFPVWEHWCMLVSVCFHNLEGWHIT
jgi:hypothetical protein